MAKTLLEYADWLDERQLLWPQPPEVIAPKATPYLKPLPGIRAVTWNVYGTLLFIADGKLIHLPREQLRMEVALDKTIHEFNMWQSMSRKPGAPWEYMYHQYQRLIEDQRLAGGVPKGEAPEVNLAEVWRILIERLGKKEYTWDEMLYGDEQEYSEKVAYFFHSALQGLAAAPEAHFALQHVRRLGCEQGLIGDGQCFTLVQLIRALGAQGTVPPLGELLTKGCVCLSFALGVRQPAASLFAPCLARFKKLGISPEEVLHVGSRLVDELAPAKGLGLKTALFAGNASSLEATPAQVNDPALRPDRILTDLRQIRQIVKRDG